MVAEALRTWLEDVIQVIKPWMSSEDIHGGSRWSTEVASRLEKAQYGIICMTRENVMAPWLHFEAGALAKSLSTGFVCPYLFDLRQSDLQGPLVQFQALTAEKDDTLKLLKALNKSLGKDARTDDQLRRIFETLWPKLEVEFASIPKSTSSRETLRTEREILEEILERVRLPSTIFGSSLWEAALRHEFNSLKEFVGGEKVETLQAKLDFLEGFDDDPLDRWRISQPFYKPGILDGEWWSRWKGGTVGDHWKIGLAFIRTAGNYLYIHHHDDLTDYLALSLSPKGKVLAGRYVNVLVPYDSTPWAARILNKDYIKGLWGQGRWDLRRAVEKPTTLQRT